MGKEESTESTEVQAKESGETQADASKESSVSTDSGMVGVQADREIAQPDDELSAETVGAKSLFGEVAPTEAELTGLEEGESSETKEAKAEPGTKEEKAAESQPKGDKKAEPAKTDKKAEDAKALEAKAEADAKAEAEKKPEPKDVKPPEGYVPHAALHEERIKRQELADELRGLQEKVSKMEQEPEEEAFKILSDEEFDELAEEDPVEAVKYERALNKHLREQEAKKVEADARQKRHGQDNLVVKQSFERMEKAVPGIHEEGNTINQDLSQFAIDNGFEPDFLQAMTAPGTLILPPGAKSAVLLGNGAAGLVEMIAKLRGVSETSDPAKIRAEVKTEVEKELRESITKELITKFKQGSIGSEAFESIGDVPGASGDAPVLFSGNLDEKRYANMTPKERERALGA